MSIVVAASVLLLMVIRSSSNTTSSMLQQRSPLVVHDISDKSVILAFVQQRKAGGDLVRYALAKEFGDQGLDVSNAILVFPCFFFFPCFYTVADPVWFEITNMSMPVRVAGHIPFREVQRIARYTPPILFSIRHPNRSIPDLYSFLTQTLEQ